MTVIPALGFLRQEDSELEASWGIQASEDQGAWKSGPTTTPCLILTFCCLCGSLHPAGYEQDSGGSPPNANEGWWLSSGPPQLPTDHLVSMGEAGSGQAHSAGGKALICKGERLPVLGWPKVSASPGSQATPCLPILSAPALNWGSSGVLSHHPFFDWHI